ncbi:uncharacterized protein LOC135222272 [Macrobrachium nipponense]|uniref:uncharacterized protein LOC135222272 n=1 Tax=Macrobrachium nipponense TaxID=159736 RepID=UPI0030C88342
MGFFHFFDPLLEVDIGGDRRVGEEEPYETMTEVPPSTETGRSTDVFPWRFPLRRRYSPASLIAYCARRLEFLMRMIENHHPFASSTEEDSVAWANWSHYGNLEGSGDEIMRMGSFLSVGNRLSHAWGLVARRRQLSPFALFMRYLERLEWSANSVENRHPRDFSIQRDNVVRFSPMSREGSEPIRRRLPQAVCDRRPLVSELSTAMVNMQFAEICHMNNLVPADDEGPEEMQAGEGESGAEPDGDFWRNNYRGIVSRDRRVRPRSRGL